MITRPKFPIQKNVIVINDTPTQNEAAIGEKFSSASNLGILTALRTGRVNVHNRKPVEGYKGVLPTDLHTTYLDTTYYGGDDVEHNYDFAQEIKQSKHLKQIRLDKEYQEGEEAQWFYVERDVTLLTEKSIKTKTFIRLAHFKDIFISYRLNEQLEGLINEIRLVEPKLIVVTGKWSLFFLTAITTLSQNMGTPKDRKPLGGLVKYRVSLMRPHAVFELPDMILLPVYPPNVANTMPDKVPVMELDMQKIGFVYNTILEKGLEYYTEPDRTYLFGTEKAEVLAYLDDLLGRLEQKPTWVSFDIETMFSQFIDCIGVTDRVDVGMCIPFATRTNPNFWSVEDEIEIMVKLREVMYHPNCKHIGQNYSYECQFYYKMWGMGIYPDEDTMVLHHMLYNYLPKDLAFLASLYCTHYVYWKDDQTSDVSETRWEYNCKDIMYTLEILEVLDEVLQMQDSKLIELYRFQIDKLMPALLKPMYRGIRVDRERKEELYKFFSTMMNDIVVKINDVLGFEFNQNSTPQKRSLFSDFLEMELKKKKNGNETCDSKAMLDYIHEYPLYKPFLTLLLEYQSLKVFTNNFLGMKLDSDGRARTSYNISGTGTGRLASRKNVFGNGGNFQNIPEKGKINLVYSIQAMGDEDDSEMDSVYDDLYVEGSIVLPNVKKVFLPDEGKEICDADLSGADIMIVAADCECKWLLDFFANPKGKVYKYIASEFFQREITDGEYKTYKGIFHGCVTGDHQVLTRNGWVDIDKFDESKELAVWNPDNSAIHFETPKSFNRDYVEASEDLFMIKGASFDFLGTQDHKFPYMLSSGKVAKAEARYLNNTARIPYSGKYVGGSNNIDPDYARLIAAFQADGTITWKDGEECSVAWKFRRDRKIDRLQELLIACDIPYQVSHYDNDFGTIDTRISVNLGYFETKHKYTGDYLLTWNKEALEAWLLEGIKWDGHTRKANGVRQSISTTNLDTATWYQTIAHICGYGSKLCRKERDETRKTLYEVSLNNRNCYNSGSGVRGLVKHNGTKVYCPQTSTGYFLCKRGDHIYVSGNTNYGMGTDKLAVTAGISFDLAKQLQEFYFRLNPEVKLWQERIARDVAVKGYITNIFGRRGWFLNKNDVTLMNKAYAFIPQSSIADVVNRGLVNITTAYPEIDVLMQVHDSIVTQYPIEKADIYRPAIKQAMEIDIPYKNVLIIPADFKVSTVSYGDTEKVKDVNKPIDPRVYNIEEKRKLETI